MNSHGAPPAYPGLGHRPVNGYGPPGYSPSRSNPPAYNPAYVRPSYTHQNTYAAYPAYGGRSFGSNTYIQNNYYGRSSMGGSGFLTNALFFGAGMHMGRGFGMHNHHHRRRDDWNENEDESWRATTKAPYFENKVPGSENVLPAAAVIGAATAFGLTTLLPLNVPSNMPLMYCNDTQIAQIPMNVNGSVFSCADGSIINLYIVTEDDDVTIFEYNTEVMDCAASNSSSDDFFCSNSTLFIAQPLVCISTTLLKEKSINQGYTFLNCYFGELPENVASFIPTATTEAPPKSYSIGASVYQFLLAVIGKSDILETTTATPELVENETLWVPEALTIPPETTTLSLFHDTSLDISEHQRDMHKLLEEFNNITKFADDNVN